MEETDRMKLLRSRRMMSDIEEVRKRQLAQKAQLKRLRDRSEREHLTAHQRALEDYDKRGVEAQAKAQKKRGEVSKEIRAQLEASKRRELDRLEAIRQDGLRIRRETEEAADEDRRKEEARRELLRKNNMEMLRANRELQEHKKEQARKEADEDARMEAYVASKQRAALKQAEFIRGKKEAADRRAKQIREKVEKDFTSFMADEGARASKAATEKREEEDKNAADLEARRQADLRERQRSWQAQLDRKARAKKQALADDRANLSKWGAIIYGLEKEELELQQKRRAEAKAIAQENLRAAARKARTVDRRREAEYKEDQEATETLVHGDDTFKREAAMLVEEERRRGHQTLALERSIKKIEKEPLLPAGPLI